MFLTFYISLQLKEFCGFKTAIFQCTEIVKKKKKKKRKIKVRTLKK